VPRSSRTLFTATDSAPYVLHKIVTVHVRRGDYEGHCKLLSAANPLEFLDANALSIYRRDNATAPVGLAVYIVRVAKGHTCRTNKQNK